MRKVESYTTNVIIFDYKSILERDNHINMMKSFGYFHKIADLNPTRVSYTKIFGENHASLTE